MNDTMTDATTDPTAAALASRRDFLKASALASGGLMLGITLTGCAKPAALGGAGGQPVAWLRIGGDDRITVLVDRSEMGQGVYTAMTQLLAEELGIDPIRVAVEAAPVGAVYVNALLGAQITGGSTSVRDAWDKLRLAGAQARTMLVQAAAAHWGVEGSTLKVQDGAVLRGNERLTFGQLAEAAAKLPVPKDVALKDPKDFSTVGKPQKRLDAPAKVDGSAVYGIDVKLPGMLHAALRQTPTLGGSVAGLDATAAEAMPGVRRVMTVTNGVAVIADHYWQAKQALDAVNITWTPGPNATLDTVSMRSKLRAAAARPGKSVRNEGDVAAGLKGAAKTLRAVYELPLLAHATLEPQN